MKVWITKYALTEGVFEADAEIIASGIISAAWEKGAKCNNFFQGEWSESKDDAISKAEKMRQKKIASLKKQIEKLEKMKFE